MVENRHGGSTNPREFLPTPAATRAARLPDPYGTTVYVADESVVVHIRERCPHLFHAVSPLAEYDIDTLAREWRRDHSGTGNPDRLRWCTECARVWVDMARATDE